MHTTVAQRIRVRYTVDGPLRYLSVLDMGRLWERLLRRAALPLAYTQGFNPHPRLAFATPLPVGYSSTMELLDVYLGATLDVDQAKERLALQCPAGLFVQDVADIALDDPPLQGIMRTADYVLSIWSASPAEEIAANLARLLASDQLPRERARQGRTARYDLRLLLLSAEYLGQVGEAHRISLGMVCCPQGVGRPEEMLDEMRIPVSHWAVCRTALHWANGQEG